MNERARFKPYGPDGREWCCYKDDACETHARVLAALVGLTQGDKSFDDTMQVIRAESQREATTADSPPKRSVRSET